ncbi:hypothetical protein [Aliiruegeria sabulilitoris]|nr:hypothetical protein [Aliiruegeria sabulilitoris]
MAEVSRGNALDIDRAVASARVAFEDGRELVRIRRVPLDADVA